MTRQPSFRTIAQTAIFLAFLVVESSCEQDTRSVGRIVQVDPELSSIVPVDSTLEKLIDGFGLLEGPVWSHGYLLFSDMRSHLIYKWHPQTGLSLFLKTGFTRSGPNGLALDKEGRLTICEHGNRRLSRLEKDGSLTVLAEQYRGKRLNSPNDLAYRSDGLLYFTDPPFGVSHPQREIPYSGIFLYSNDKLELLTDELSEPNGLTFSPDEKYLFVGNDNHRKPVIHRFGVNGNGSLAKSEKFFDAWSLARTESLDGMKTDIQGNLYVSGSNGIIIISPTGKHLGTLQVPDETTNIAWGDADRKALYITGAKSLYRIRLNIPGHQVFPD